MKTKIFTLALALLAQIIFAQITGIWKGDLEIQGMKLPLIIRINPENGTYKSVAYSPKQSVEGIPVDKTTFANGDFSFEIKMLKAQYSGKMQGEEIVGNFTQNGATFPLNLHQISEEKFKNNFHADIPPIGNRDINFKKIDDYLDYIAKNNQGIGSVSIFRHGKEVYRKDFGQSGISAKFDKNTGYQIGSISKLMTATMLMQQVEKGNLKLTDKLAKFFPDAPNADKITIENMLNHTSGLGNYVGADANWLFKNVGEKAIFDKIKKEGVAFQPGEKMEYSNSAYWLLSRILEKITKKPYNVLLKENITQKVGMTNTFSVLDNPKNIYAAYEFNGKSWQNLEDFDFHNAVGLGDVTSSTEDLNKFINALFQGKLVKSETLKMMLPQKRIFGLGISGVPFYNIKSYGHGGDTIGQHSAVAYEPNDDFSIAYAFNGERMGHNDVAVGILNIIYNQDFELPKFDKPEISQEDFKKFSGDYISKENPLAIKIFKHGRMLLAQGQAKGQGAFDLAKTAENEFESKEVGVKMTFAKDGKTMTMTQNGKSFSYKKK